VVGYAMVYSIAAMLDRSRSTETEAMLEAMAGLELSSPFGRITWREIDHQATMGAYVGRTAVEDGKPTMVNWYYADGADHLPPDEVVRKLRPSGA
jgi:branched-chain amino acid transport system substrate-binding protein